MFMHSVRTHFPGRSWKLKILWFCATVILIVIFTILLNANWLETKIQVLEIIEDVGDLTIDCNYGRLGNQMFTYATLIGVARYNHRTAYVPSCLQYDVLKKYFHVTLNTTDYSKVDKSKVYYITVNNFTVPQNRNAFNVQGKYPVAYYYFERVRNKILREFRFRPFVLEYADNVLRNVRKNRSENVTFVAIHVRRGDFHSHLCRMKAKNEASPAFYQKAMDMYRKNYSQVAFVVASDTPEWARANVQGNDVYYVGNKKLDPVFDMAVLARCNHTIFAYGTFGFWAAYLSGGDAIYLADLKKSNPQLDTSLKDQHVYLPSWTAIEGSIPLKCKWDKKKNNFVE